DFIGKNLDDPMVQKALKDNGIEVPKSLNKAIQDKGFAKAMSEHYEQIADKQIQAGGKDKYKVEVALRNACYFDPGNTDRFKKLGEVAMKQDDIGVALEA